MHTYVAFAKGINVGGQKKILMADLRTMFKGLSFQTVRTYIQSGNIVFESDDVNTDLLSDKIQKAIADTFDFEVAVLVFTVNELQEILNSNPFTEEEDIVQKRVYFALLKSEPIKRAIDSLKQTNFPNEIFHISKNCVYLNCLNGAGKAKLTNTVLEKKLGVIISTRNHRTMLNLIAVATP